MTIPVIAGHELVNKDHFLAGLTSRHPVSDEFIEAVRPTINAIFMNVPDELRARMIRLAEDSFRRQSEAEEILRRARAGVARMKAFHQEKTSRRRSAVVASRQSNSQKKRALKTGS